MEEEIRALLLGSTDIQTLVGGRVNWGVHPQAAGWPALVLTADSSPFDTHMKGAGALWQGLLQVDCYALEFSEALILSRAVTGLMNFYRGGGFRLIQLSAVRSEREAEGGADGMEKVYRVSVDFDIKWRSSNE